MRLTESEPDSSAHRMLSSRVVVKDPGGFRGNRSSRGRRLLEELFKGCTIKRRRVKVAGA